MRISYFNRNGIEAKIGDDNQKVVPWNVIENVKELAPKTGDGTAIEGFGTIWIYLPIEEFIEESAVYFNFLTTI